MTIGWSIYNQSTGSLCTFCDFNQYWQLLALDVGTYDTDDINAGGAKGAEIKQTIKEDFTRYQYKALVGYHC